MPSSTMRPKRSQMLRDLFSGFLISIAPLIHNLLNDKSLFAGNQELVISLAVVVVATVIQQVIPAALLTWILWWVFRQLGRRTLFARCALSGFCLAVCGSAALRVSDPPSAAFYFHATFAAQLPRSAGDIRVYPMTPAGASVWFYFTTTPPELEQMCREMGMPVLKPIVNKSWESFAGWCPVPRGWPDYRCWEHLRASWVRFGETGCEHYLIADVTGRCYVYKDPLASKTDAELRGGYSK